MSNIIGPIDRSRWNMLRLYRSSVNYHSSKCNVDALEMIRPIYKEALSNSVRKVS